MGQRAGAAEQLSGGGEAVTDKPKTITITPQQKDGLTSANFQAALSSNAQTNQSVPATNSGASTKKD